LCSQFLQLWIFRFFNGKKKILTSMSYQFTCKTTRIIKMFKQSLQDWMKALYHLNAFRLA
jgi:hypothetical protein